MESHNRSLLFMRLKQSIEKPSKLWYIILALCSLVLAWGLYAFILQFIEGHAITGMRDNVVWGVYIVNFIFLLGFSYAGAMISGIFHLARIERGKPIIRIIEIFSFITLLVAPVYILLCIGRLDRLYLLFTSPRLQSPITWDIIAIMTDLIFCFVYLYMTFIKDMAFLRDNSPKLKMANWRKKLYGFLSMGYTGNENEEKYLNKAMDMMAAILIPTAIVAYSLLAWLFGMNLRPGWNSSIFAPYFVLTAVFSGVALLIVMIGVSRYIFKIKDILTDDYFYLLGYALLFLSFIFGYFAFSDYITYWYNSQIANTVILEKISGDGKFSLMYILTFVFATALPIIFIGFPWFRKPKTIVMTAAFVIVALYFNRYLIIVPILESPFLSIVNPDPAFYDYSPTWVEYALSAAGMALMVILFMIITKFIPILPITEMEEKTKSFKIFGLTVKSESK